MLMIICTQSFAQLGVGTATPNAAAQLDVVATDKGILIPRIALTALTDATTITSGNVESMMVYNTNTTANLSPGYYYWANGTWNKVATQSEITALPKDVTSTNGSITGTASNAALAVMNLEVKVDDSTIEVDASNGLQLKDAGITAAKIKENAVDGTKIKLTGEANGSMLYNNGTDWVDFPKGTAGQYLKMNAAGTAPEWATEVKPVSKRIGEFVYAKTGKTVADGYLPVAQGTITDGAVDYPLWAAQYPEFVSGDDIVFPVDVAGMFLRNTGGNAAAEGTFQDDATARPNTAFTTDSKGYHSHSLSGSYTHSVRYTGNNTVTAQDNHAGGTEYDVNSSGVPSINAAGNHTHTITGGGDNETRPVNRAYQLYTIVDTY